MAIRAPDGAKNLEIKYKKNQETVPIFMKNEK